MGLSDSGLWNPYFVYSGSYLIKIMNSESMLIYPLKIFISQQIFFECPVCACLASGAERNKKETLTLVVRPEL